MKPDLSENGGELFIDFQTLSLRLEGILAETHDQLLRAQAASSVSHHEGEMSSQALIDLQGMDVGTQTVAAIGSILGKVKNMPDPARLSVSELLVDVTLFDVVRKVSGHEPVKILIMMQLNSSKPYRML